MAYEKKQPYIYRAGANSAFHEAIGDTIGMYAGEFRCLFSFRNETFIMNTLVSPTHSVKLGIIDEETITPHYEINYLMNLALQKVAFLPYGYAMDKYRFTLFRESNKSSR